MMADTDMKTIFDLADYTLSDEEIERILCEEYNKLYNDYLIDKLSACKELGIKGISLYLRRYYYKQEGWENYTKELHKLNLPELKTNIGEIRCNLEDIYTFLLEKGLEVNVTKEDDGYVKMYLNLPQKTKTSEQAVKQKV